VCIDFSRDLVTTQLSSRSSLFQYLLLLVKVVIAVAAADDLVYSSFK
jgi:hypothetical protein